MLVHTCSFTRAGLHVKVYTRRCTSAGLHVQFYTCWFTREGLYVLVYKRSFIRAGLHVQVYAYWFTREGVHLQDGVIIKKNVKLHQALLSFSEYRILITGSNKICIRYHMKIINILILPLSSNMSCIYIIYIIYTAYY